MKKITSIICLLLCSTSFLFSQTNLSFIEQQEIQQAAAVNNVHPVTVQSVLQKLNAAGDQAGFDNINWTQEERLVLKSYYKLNGRAVMADIIPTAGATETFSPAQGDFFFDPGGPGGSSTGGTPGNYPNCACVTTTTLDGVTEIDFLFFSVFATFDWLKIYDGPDTTGPVLFNNASGGANAGDITLADMIASNGSSTFTGTSGSITFEFNATAVVDYGGWEVEIVTVGGGGGGGGTDVYAFDAGFCSDDFGTFPLAGPFNISSISTSTTAIFAGDFDDTNTLYAMDNNALTLITIDTNNGAETTVGPLTNILGGHGTRGLAWNPDNSTMYLLSGAGDDHTLYTVDLSTGTLTVVGTAVIPGGLGIWLAIDNNGNAYMADIGSDSLYSMDLATAQVTPIGPLGININFAQDADFDPDTGTLYMGAYIGGGVNEFASVDTATGTATPLGTVNANCAELGIVAFLNPPPMANNDTCAGASPVACGDVVVGTTADNTDTGGNNASPDEWYSFTGTGSEELVTVSLCGGGTTYDSRLTVFDSCGGAIIVTNDDSCGLQSEVSFLSDGTSTYYIAVEGFATASAGAFSMAITCAAIAANDDCSGALSIACGETLVGSTTNATFDAGAPVCATSITTNGVWYVFEDTSGLVTDYVVSLCDGGTNYDSKLTVYSGDCGTLTCVGDNDDTCGLQSEVAFQGDGSTTYYILVHGFGSSTGDFSLNVSCLPVPPPNDMIVNSIDVDEIGFPYTDPAVAMPAATVEGGNPSGCNIDGGKGVWYNFVSAGNGTATASIVSPAGASFVTFFKAPNEMATEGDLEYFFQVGNQCAPATTADINTEAGQAYYVYVVNDGGVTDIVIDGTLLSTNDNTIEGFSYYPNPTNNILNLDAVDMIDQVTLYNILGQQVLDRKVGATSTQLDVAALTSGTYIMKVSVNGETGTYKLVKE